MFTSKHKTQTNNKGRKWGISKYKSKESSRFITITHRRGGSVKDDPGVMGWGSFYPPERHVRKGILCWAKRARMRNRNFGKLPESPLQMEGGRCKTAKRIVIIDREIERCVHFLFILILYLNLFHRLNYSPLQNREFSVGDSVNVSSKPAHSLISFFSAVYFKRMRVTEV